MSRQRWIVVVVAVVAVAAIVWWWGARAAAKAPRYRTAAVERGTIESVVSATGTVQPVEQVEVGTQVSGTVAKLYADYNTRVYAGQVLCQLETSLFRARQLQSRAGVARAEAAVKDAQRSLNRSLELLPQKYVSQADVDAAEATLEKAQADLQQARAQLTAADVDLAHATISAPIEGVVIARSVDLGQTVAASLQAPKLFVIARDLAQMQVETRIDEADIGVVHPGLPATFTVDAFPDLTFHGRVTQVRLEPIVEQGVVTYTTVIRTENPGLKLRPGMTANVSVMAAKLDDVLKVPAAALRFRPPENGRGRQGGPGAGPGSERGGGRVTAGGERGAGTGAMRGGGGAMPGSEGMRGTRRGRPTGAPDMARGPVGQRAGESDLPALKPGTVYVLRNGRPVPVPVMSGMSDGTAAQVESDQLEPGDLVVIGVEVGAAATSLRPPPGMGGPMFGGPRGGRPGGGR